jgi:predicted nucleic acid-binding protein
VIVLDASAMVDVVLDQPVAAWVLDAVDGEVVCAPAHQPAEVISAIARLQRAGELSEAAARGAMAEAAGLRQELVLPTRLHLARCLELQDRARVLDGLYVALAEERGVPLVTTDQRLVRAAPPCEVRAPDV